jgi:hypothetical protein
MIQFNSIQFIYLRASLTAYRPIIKPAREDKTYTNKNKTMLIIIILVLIIIIIPLTQIKSKIMYSYK